MIVYEFLYSDSVCESAAQTISIHKTWLGATNAMQMHMLKEKEEYERLFGMDSDFNIEEYKEDKHWGIIETEVLE